MNHSDIKLVIDRLHSVDMFISAEDNLIIAEAISALETLGNQVAKQAVVIEKLRAHLVWVDKYVYCEISKDIRVALAIPTDSKQILAEWLDKQLGKPVGYQEIFDAIAVGTKPYAGSGISISVKAFTDYIGPLFKKPEIN